MKRHLNISRYHWIVVFALAGLFAALFAFATYNLFHLTMSNFSFLQRFGLMAVQEGALLQTLQIAAGGTIALFCYFGFKNCETELISRFRRWTRNND